MTKWNVPGNSEYRATVPIDVVLRSDNDQKLRGYWLAWDAEDGQLCFVSNQNEIDGVVLDTDEDGTPIIRFSDEATEFAYDETTKTIRVKRYS